MNQKEIEDLLKRHEEGNCTPEEEQRLKSWFDTTSASGTWNWGKDEQSQQGIRLKSRIDARIGKSGKASFSLLTLLKVAASVVLISTLFLGWRERKAIRNYIDPVVYLQSATTPGKRVKIQLSDGTTVFLNANSKLRYPAKFNRETREIELLEGEAFFDVVHNSEKPFIVISGKTRTVVLGTAFNIRAYASLEEIQVAVSRGKVAVSQTGHQGTSSGTPVFLLPDEQLSLNRKTGVTSKTRTEPNTIAAWTDGRLVFSNESLRNVALVLENAFDVKLSFEEKTLENIRFTATFDQRDTFNEILFAIAKSNGLIYSQSGKNIVFNKKTKYKHQTALPYDVK